jgi:hypothetical protein
MHSQRLLRHPVSLFEAISRHHSCLSVMTTGRDNPSHHAGMVLTKLLREPPQGQDRGMAFLVRVRSRRRAA